MTSESTDLHQFFVSCPKGLEELVAQELLQIEAQALKNTVAGVYFKGTLAHGYGLCMHSRLANRVTLQLTNPWRAPEITSSEDLYAAALAIDWAEHLTEGTSIAVDFSGTNQAITNTQFGAVRVKDAIVDQLRERHGWRPDVDRNNPGLRIHVRLSRDRAHISLDLSGDSLHRRGYRSEQGAAPLKENLAAALLLRAGWPAVAARGGSFMDLMCGAGTLPIEAALMATDCAPGLLREKFGFEQWRQHDPELWQRIKTEAQARFEAGKQQTLPVILGFDRDPRLIAVAQRNLARASMADYVQFSQAELTQFKPPRVPGLQPGLILCNPPYGERLGEIEALRPMYRQLAQICKQECTGWILGVFTSNPELAREMRLRPKRKNRLFNGTLASELCLYELLDEQGAVLREDRPDQLTEGAQMVLNRLKKNQARLKGWLGQGQTNAYRLYDADIPEYSAAVDVYGEQLHVQEYAPPASIPPAVAEKRLNELLQACASYAGVVPEVIAVKTRQRNRGKQQYTAASERQGRQETVFEGSAKLLVNRWDYLDTGLFLDHRPLRLRIAQEAQGTRFLNLFCYTASATVHAALGGARQSVSVDMSHTYLEWAKQNFELNRINLSRHELVQEDCLTWLQNCRSSFDLIMLDPPTFSNSKRMDSVLDIQRDHATLVARCMELLNPGGTLYFSTNLRKFKMDASLAERYQVNDLTEQTIPPDFQRNRRIHQCFAIQHGTSDDKPVSDRQPISSRWGSA